MDENNSPTNPQITQNLPQPDSVSFIALGGLEDVTRNLYVYDYKDQILIVDCGIGFPDETMLGVDLLLPDITYLLDIIKTGKKKIIGMLLTHGHEDHIGGTPFILPQLMPDGRDDLKFPVYASPLTAALTNAKFKEYNLPFNVTTVKFTDPDVQIGPFTISFIRVTHSVPDSANFFIKSPAGNFFHGSDYKFDLTPSDGQRSDFIKINNAAEEGVLALISDCLGSDRPGHTKSEANLGRNFERAMRDVNGKFIITTYSSNIARLNQAIAAAEKVNRKVCFVGRSVLKVKEIGASLGYLKIKPETEVDLRDLGKFKSNQLMLVVAGSQGQENSALTRIANGEHKDIRIGPGDAVVFSSDTIPGNEINVNELVNAITKKGARVIDSDSSGWFHVSGHGSRSDHELLVALTKPRYLLPISGTYRHMGYYKTMAEDMGYEKKNILMVENGQEIKFGQGFAKFGNKIGIRNIYVDQVSGEEVENFVIRDRERLAKEGIVIVMAEIRAQDGQLAEKPIIVARGSSLVDSKEITDSLADELGKMLTPNKGKVTNWVHLRRLVSETTQKHIFKKFRTRPLVMPVVIEV
ncbi:MAG TPA: ribonuclease J [Candidatus Saccharimonadales bacterium]|nr:ribonuclease J [Candidatus Saccharimonadales bacterium]